MQTISEAIDILKKLPLELCFETFKYLDGLDLVNFINHPDIINNDIIKSTNIIPEVVDIWNLINNQDKLLELCKILYYADINNKYYKDTCKIHCHKNFTLQGDYNEKYITKLKMGLFLNVGLDIYTSRNYSKLTFDKIKLMFQINKDYPNEFTFEILYYVCDTDDFLNCAYKFKELFKYSINVYDAINRIKNIVFKFPHSYYERFISLVNDGIKFEFAYALSTPSRKFTDALIDKFNKLRKELNINHEIIINNLRNNTVINQIKIFINNGINNVGNIISLDKNLISYLINNNLFYNFDYMVWQRIQYLFRHNNDLFPDIFTKFTIKQQYQMRIKELMEDGDLIHTINTYQIININHIHSIDINNMSKAEYFKKIYTELTEEQQNMCATYIQMGFNLESALLNATSLDDN